MNQSVVSAATPRRSEYRRGIGKIRACPPAYKGIAAGTGLSDDEFWTICWALFREYGATMSAEGPQDYAGRVWEAAGHVKAEGREVGLITVWSSAQSKVRTWDIREMANAISVPRPRAARKTVREALKILALRPVRFEAARFEAAEQAGWTPGTITEERLLTEQTFRLQSQTFRSPDTEMSEWEKFYFSEDEARPVLEDILLQHSHQGADLLMEVLQVAAKGDQPALGPAVGKVAKQHGLPSRQVRSTITDFIAGIGGDFEAVLQVLRARGHYATRPVADL